jgi:hypothetical protein
MEWHTILALVIILALGSVLMLVSGCSSLYSGSIRNYDVDCKECKVKIKYDISQTDKNLEIKGL